MATIKRKSNCPCGTNPVKIGSTQAKFCHERIKDPKKFDPKSFRTKVYRAHRITFGCPKGKYSKGICRVPVQIQAILHPVGEAKCPTPGAMIKKNPFLEKSIITNIINNKKEKEITKDEYRRLKERTIGKLYHQWVKDYGFMRFTDWEKKVLHGDIILKRNPFLETSLAIATGITVGEIGKKALKKSGVLKNPKGIKPKVSPSYWRNLAQRLLDTYGVFLPNTVLRRLKNITSEFGVKVYDEDINFIIDLRDKLKLKKKNPGAKWHEDEEIYNEKMENKLRDLKDKEGADYFYGKKMAHRESKQVARRMGMNPRTEDDIKNADLFIKRFLKGELLNNLIDEFKRFNAVTVGFLSELKRKLRPVDYKLIHRRIGTEYVKWKKSLKKNPIELKRGDRVQDVEDASKLGTIRQIYYPHGYLLTEEKRIKVKWDSGGIEDDLTADLLKKVVKNPMYHGRAKLEALALRLYKSGWGVDSVIMELKKKFDVPSSVAEYIAKQAARISRGEVKDNPKAKGATKIYDRILSIEAKKGKSSNFPNENFRHDFSSKDAEILGMPDGSLKIRSKTGKKLWKNFNYPEKGKK